MIVRESSQTPVEHSTTQMTHAPAKSTLMSVSLSVLFFLSGFSALAYQMIWQRLLGFFCGVETSCITIVVAAYMLGMGLGSIVGGVFADKFSRPRLVLTFAVAELMIAAFALSSKFLIYDVLCGMLNQLADSQILLGVSSFVVLLVPTFCMGVTLPVLSKALLSQKDEASTTIGTLYGVNTLGAAFGALLTPVILIRNIGLDGSLAAGAVLNILSLIGAFAIFYRLRRKHEAILTDVEQTPSQLVTGDNGFIKWSAIYCLSGFVALSLELVWFRAVSVMLKPNSFTIGWLLCVYLLGVALGSLVGIRAAKKLKNCSAGFFSYKP